MAKLCFYGRNDDTFGEYGVTQEEVDTSGSPSLVQCVVDCGEHGRLMVAGQYSLHGCWLAGVCRVDEDDPFPDWEIMRSLHSGDYFSMALTVTLPADDFSLEWYINGKKVE